MILKFKGLDNINDIEKYRQKSLYVTRKNAVRLQRDEYFIADLIGLKVQDEGGKELGMLSTRWKWQTVRACFCPLSNSVS